MKITPLDIQKKQFGTKFRGYDTDDVDEYLDLVAESMEEILQENLLLKDRLKDLEGRIDEYRTMEANLEKTLLTAQTLTDQMKSSAEKEAGLVIEQARREAEEILKTAQEQARAVEGEIRSLKTERKKFQAQMRSLVEEHLAVINAVPDDENIIALAQKK